MLRAKHFTAVIVMLLSGCGDIDGAAKTVSGYGENASSQPDLPSKEKTDGKGHSNGRGLPTCLTNCDNGAWKSLMFDEMPLQNLTIVDGCNLAFSAAFPRSPKIEILSVVNCSGLGRLYRWSVNNVGSMVDSPVQIGQCAVGQKLNQLRRSAGSAGILTLWACFDSSAYSNRYSYFVQLEDLAGKQIYSRFIFGSYYKSEVEIAFAKEVDLWAVAFKGNVFRVNRNGILSGNTTWSGALDPRHLSVREGVFQIMEGDTSRSAHYCSRITFGGTLLCRSNNIGNRFDSAQPIEGSRYLLMQDGDEISAGLDSASGCSVSGEALMITRHNENHSLLRAIAIDGTPYVAALAVSEGKLVFDLIQTSPEMQHLTTLPLENASEWTDDNFALFQMGERVYATLVSTSGLRIVSLAKPEVTR